MKRLTPEVNSVRGDAFEDPDGDYVLFEDADRLAKALEAVMSACRYNVVALPASEIHAICYSALYPGESVTLE